MSIYGVWLQVEGLVYIGDVEADNQEEAQSEAEVSAEIWADSNPEADVLDVNVVEGED